MTEPLAGAATNRRNFLGLIGLSAVTLAGGGLLAGCGGTKTSGSGSAQQLDKFAAILPKQKDLALGISPDVKGVRPMFDGYSRFPGNVVSAISEAPGKSGQKITAMTPQWGPAPAGIGKNTYIDGVNAKLGIPIDFSIQDGVTYADKLNAMLGARDVPDLLCIPSWEVEKLPRFADAAKALFEDLTDYVKGDAVNAYPMLATFPTPAWKDSIWNERLMAVPNPSDGLFPWALFARKDLLDAQGLAFPKSIDELHELFKKVNNPSKNVWACDNVFDMVQMYYKVPGSKGGWRVKSDGTPEFKYETPEYKQAVEFMAKIFKEGLVHPDIVANKNADKKQLFASGKILFTQDGVGAWQPLQAEQQKVTPTINIQPVPVFSATGGDPLVWATVGANISYTFIKKGLGKERVEELLRVINYCSAPFGTAEYMLINYGIEGKHYTMSANGPAKTELSFKEMANQYFFVSGRNPVVAPTADTPNYVQDLITYSNAMVPYLEKDPWAGVKLEMPAKYKANLVPSEDKVADVLRGRRPLSDLDTIVGEWKANGGDEARTLMAQNIAKK